MSPQGAIRLVKLLKNLTNLDKYLPKCHQICLNQTTI